MRYDENLDIFIEHFDWYIKDDKTGCFYIPTSKAPKEAVEAMERVNKRKEWEIKQGIYV